MRQGRGLQRLLRGLNGLLLLACWLLAVLGTYADLLTGQPPWLGVGRLLA